MVLGRVLAQHGTRVLGVEGRDLKVFKGLFMVTSLGPLKTPRRVCSSPLGTHPSPAVPSLPFVSPPCLSKFGHTSLPPPFPPSLSPSLSAQVFLPKLYEDDPENPDADGNPGKKEIVREIPPPYPKEDWKTFNDEQEHLRDKMCLDFEALMEAERQAAEEARKLAEAEAVNSET